MRWWETAIKHPNPLVLRGFQGRWDGDGVQFCAASNRDHCASQKQAAETLRAPRAQPGLLNNTYTHTRSRQQNTHANQIYDKYDKPPAGRDAANSWEEAG